MSIIDKSIQKLEQSKKKVDSAPIEKTELKAEDQTKAVEPQEAPISAESSTSQQTQTNVESNNSSTNFVELNDEVLAQKGFIANTGEKSIHGEEFRSLKRKVINNAFGSLAHTLEASNLIMVTSCVPGEGKTFNAINLALSIAQEKDKTVLLVDSDVLRPSIARQLDIHAENGLTDYLNGKVENLQDVMLSTSVEKLRVLPAGNLYTLSAELLASNKMVELVKEFATRYKDRVVIFDAPPMLGINETAVLAELVGQILIVVEEDKTKLSDIQDLLNLLPEHVAKGFIMNKSVTTKQGGYGY